MGNLPYMPGGGGAPPGGALAVADIDGLQDELDAKQGTIPAGTFAGVLTPGVPQTAADAQYGQSSRCNVLLRGVKVDGRINLNGAMTSGSAVLQLSGSGHRLPRPPQRRNRRRHPRDAGDARRGAGQLQPRLPGRPLSRG